MSNEAAHCTQNEALALGRKGREGKENCTDVRRGGDSFVLRVCTH